MSHQIQLTVEELYATQMALETAIEEMDDASSDPKIPFNAEARKTMREILGAMKSAKAKIALISGHDVKLDPYKEGDEQEFLTKPS